MTGNQITRRLNKIYAHQPSKIDPAWLNAQVKVLIAAAPGEDPPVTLAEKRLQKDKTHLRSPPI